MRYIGLQEVEDISLGAAVMASGGGGNPYLGTLIAKECVNTYGPIQLLTLDEIPDDWKIAVSMGLGAPSVLVEKVPNGREAGWAMEVLEHAVGHGFDAVMASEAGGWNSLHPMLPAAERHLPLIDADGMGRAFPQLDMETWSVAGLSCNPIGVADERGNKLCVYSHTNKMGEDICRSATVAMGGNISTACYHMTGRFAKDHSVWGTYTLCETVGRIIRLGRAGELDTYAELQKTLRFKELFRGKIQDVERRTEGGFTRGLCQLEGFEDYEGSSMEVRFQNEYLVASVNGQVKCVTPDLIVMFDTESFYPITSEQLKYGCRALVVGVPCAQQWRTPEGLAVVGPELGFGYPDIAYAPVEELNA
ncbi:MAG: DUF917 domain-containing protein [Eggerthellales bacterium]|nr:DUF917 domain-containing protein [Eggerthellales bacterium]